MKFEKNTRSLIVAQDIKIVKALAGNNAELRNRALKNLQKWLEVRSKKIPFTEQEFVRLWKGLFYTMWMSDKPLIQEQCAENIAHLIHFPDAETSLLFFKCALSVLATEWFGIDQFRLDKFLMFVRRILRQALVVLKNCNWQLKTIAKFGEILSATVFQSDYHNHLGLTLHIIEIYLEELAKVSKGDINSSIMGPLLKPFMQQLATGNDRRLTAHIKKYFFNHLLLQTDEGIEYQAKFQAWKGEGFPGGTIDCMQNVREVDDTIIEDDEIDNQALDPRAGEVDVSLPQLKFNAKQISELLLAQRFAGGSTVKSREAITDLSQKFEKLSKGKFPLGIKGIEIPTDNGNSTNIKKAVNRLVKFEKQLLGNNSNSRKRKMKEKINGTPIISKKKRNIETPNPENNSTLFQEELNNFIEKSDGGKNSVVNSLQNNATITKLDANTSLFEKQLQNFIKKSEGSKINKASATPLRKLKDNLFPKKTGENFIEKSENDKHKNLIPTLKKRKADLADSTSLFEKKLEKFIRKSEGTKLIKVKNSKLCKTSMNQSPSATLIIRNSGVWVVESLDNSTDSDHNNSVENIKPTVVFPQTEWDLPPKDGEVEIFVPSNKYKKKIQNLSGKLGKSSSVLLNDTLQKHIKPRYSLDSNICINPFSSTFSTPRSEKKVKINLKLNSSQEIYEHRAQLRRSPAIPFDATKKPTKPLLKASVGSPINPFRKAKYYANRSQ